MFKTFIVAIMVVLLASCATKRYGRPLELTDAEKSSYTCKDINIELAKAAEFRKMMSDEAKVDARSIGAFLMDFGIGNSMEKNAAERAIASREADLMSLRATKNCGSENQSAEQS